ncbi:DUF3857 domain-containing protein [Aquimarina sediminis]|uniref:DUF3857 domain-containing protein n=1 Tax=Aquimarina sediminis TaxID=2070536 RepID=UPI000CA042CD|nr:DUF3857 domain-containing protein [Aquimarina sediminis]
MIKSITFLILISFSLITSAQKINPDMKVSLLDLKNNTYQKDSTANAFFIYEKGYSRVENGGNYNLLTDYEAKVKIINEQGFDNATINVFLYQNKNDKELFRKLIAYTYNLENGKITKTKIENKNIYTEKYNENYTLVKFTFPNLKPGSVLTYQYQIESPFMFKFNGWDFQDDIPKLYSEYIADLPGNYLYNIKLIGVLKLEYQENNIIKKCLEVSRGGYADCSHSKYIMKNIPAFKEEKYMTAKKNYFSRIDYELKEFKGFDGINKKFTETWKNVDAKFKKEATIGIQLKKVSAAKDILPDTIQSMPNDISKAKLIYRYITNNYKWNKKNRIFKNGNISKVIKEKVGNVNDINILLHNTLKQQKFKVLPVLLSTRENGYATKIHPVISDFNYIIVQLSLGKNSYLLDATENCLAFGEIPFRCLNQYGRLLDFKNGSSWIDITPSKRSVHFFKEDLVLNDKLELIGKSKQVYSGYHAYSKRKEIDQSGSGAFLDKIKNQNPEISISDININNQTNFEKPIEIKFNFTRSITEIDSVFYIKPFTTAFFNKNPFKLNQRTYPVDFGYKDSYNYLVTIELSEKFDFIDIPQKKAYTLPKDSGLAVISFQKIGNNKLVINHRITFDSSYYPSEYYDVLKEFFNLIVTLGNDSLIAVKRIH